MLLTRHHVSSLGFVPHLHFVKQTQDCSLYPRQASRLTEPFMLDIFLMWSTKWS